MAGPEAWSLPPGLPVTALTAGVHPPGPPGSIVDRVLDCYELIFVRGGEVPIAELDHEFVVAKDEALVLLPGRRHRGTRPYRRDMWFYWVCFNLPAHKGRRGLQVPQHCRPARPERLVELFERYLADQKSGSLRPRAASLLVLLMLEELVLQPSPQDLGQEALPILARRAARYIEQHLTDAHGLSTAAIAATLRCNPDYLGRVFRKAYGRTLVEHVHRRRVERARWLLHLSDRPVEEVAHACGFEDVRYFRRLFTRYAGLTPSTYRRLRLAPQPVVSSP